MADKEIKQMSEEHREALARKFSAFAELRAAEANMAKVRADIAKINADLFRSGFMNMPDCWD
ncbi:MAG: hypothetical protein R3B70_38900 [Polyangiaceae bacterium]